MPQLIAPWRQAMVRAPASAAGPPARRYARHIPERTLLYALVQAHYPDFLERLAHEDRAVPGYVREEFDEFLRCGVLEHGFLRVACEHCHAERLVAFSCKKRGFCPSCGARRMAESAKHLVEDVFGPRPVRQWVLSIPYPLRFLFASKPDAIGPVLGIVQRVIAGWLADQAVSTVPRRNGTTHVEFEPIDFIAKLAGWCRRHARTWPASTASSHPTRSCVRNSRHAFLARTRLPTRTPITARRRKGVDR